MTTPLGDRILAALQYAGLTQKALEIKLWPQDPHKGSGRISRYISGERGRSVSPQLFERMADVLGVDFQWLLTGRGAMTPPKNPPPARTAK